MGNKQCDEVEPNKDVEYLAAFMFGGAKALFPNGTEMLRAMVGKAAAQARWLYEDAIEEDGRQSHEVCLQSIIARFAEALDRAERNQKRDDAEDELRNPSPAS